MRQILLDTETTGIGHEQGHKIIEIGCVELLDRKLTGNHYHVYLNPQRLVDEGAFRVHGISDEFLKDKPLFKDVADEFISFIEGAELIIHNAAFDLGFLNSELKHIKSSKKIEDYCKVLDTLELARKKHPGSRNNLDALCKRYEIDNSNRTLHGALLDAEILAFVYLAMTGGQTSLFAETKSESNTTEVIVTENTPLHQTHAIVIKASDEELAQHNTLIEYIVKKSGVDYWTKVEETLS